MKTLLRLLLLTAASAGADDSPRLAELLAAGGTVTIPPGDYRLDGAQPLPLASNMTVFAHGARFILPEKLPDKARVVLFAGQDIAHLAWHGGEFIGHVFDPAQRENRGSRTRTRRASRSPPPGPAARTIFFFAT